MLKSSFHNAMETFFEEAVREAEKRIMANIRNPIVKHDEIIDVNEAAKMLKVSPQTLYGLCRQKKIPHRKLGNRTVFSVNALESWGREQDELNYRKDEVAN
ncbi:helix-turn-helix domain-containing protein [Paenibacillus sp. FSL R5-0527]|uniref:helix-turn-helix domain-containing protein n=1 Tax=Paenibacillus sp. FSL R5-0527 TaxID=2975321 RepID=UPI000979CF67|nr:hypothetical protein BK140_32610 [Paenibacillus macerans]